MYKLSIYILNKALICLMLISSFQAFAVPTPSPDGSTFTDSAWTVDFPGSLDSLYEFAFMSLEERNIITALRSFSLIASRRNILYKGGLKEKLIYVASAYYLDLLESRIIVRPEGEWNEKKPGYFVDGDIERLYPDKPFSLAYVDGEMSLPLAGLFYSFGGEGETEWFPSDSQGGGTIPSRFFSLQMEDVTITMRLSTDKLNTDYLLYKRIYWEFPAPCVKITIRNGEKAGDLVKRLIEKKLVTETAVIRYCASRELKDYPWVPGAWSSIRRFEGLFTPGEYAIRKSRLPFLDAVRKKKADQAFKNVDVIVSELLSSSRGRFEKLGNVRGVKPFEQIILASIVEKEAVSNRDYDKIASVFYNRYTRGGRLGSCPTVEYALGYHRPFLTKADVSIDSPYNVYRRKGLPPTPICFFSDEALWAVRNPPVTRLFYFVYDWTTGKLKFASRYSDHVINADTAKRNYIRVFGEAAMRKKRYDLFYGE
ncbi:MAG: endolytic transglycosylase MltG [Spirochaetales bacterium]|nr:endolytic transglycosylase MltG [Spirochaetales bacterium]